MLKRILVMLMLVSIFFTIAWRVNLKYEGNGGQRWI